MNILSLLIVSCFFFFFWTIDFALNNYVVNKLSENISLSCKQFNANTEIWLLLTVLTSLWLLLTM